MTTTETMVKMVFDRWNASIKNCDALISSLSDEQLYKEIVPGKNRGIYLLGHLVAAHDEMLVLLGMGEKLYPELYEPFLKLPDNASAAFPPAATLRSYWTNQCRVLQEKFAALQPAQWFEKHTAVSVEDFEKEPNRNKLNVILTRSTHLQYHMGQMQLLK